MLELAVVDSRYDFWENKEEFGKSKTWVLCIKTQFRLNLVGFKTGFVQIYSCAHLLQSSRWMHVSSQWRRLHQDIPSIFMSCKIICNHALVIFANQDQLKWGNQISCKLIMPRQGWFEGINFDQFPFSSLYIYNHRAEERIVMDLGRN
jgi:hypothetical protein